MEHVKPGLPPALVMHPRDDATVPVREAEEFHAQMHAAGNRCDLKLWDEGGHGFFNYWDGKNPYFYETLEAVDRFLTSLGWLSGPPAVKGFTFRHLPVNPDKPGVD
ncbi:MAG: hypothetical protein ABIF71_04920 [Planctomycetota bacterium]